MHATYQFCLFLYLLNSIIINLKIFSCPLAAMTYSQNYQNHGYVQLIFTQRYEPCKPIDSSCCIFFIYFTSRQHYGKIFEP